MSFKKSAVGWLRYYLKTILFKDTEGKTRYVLLFYKYENSFCLIMGEVLSQVVYYLSAKFFAVHYS